MKTMLEEIKNAVQTGEVVWTEAELPPEAGARGSAFKGWYKKEWLFIVVEFDIEDQGFPPGSKGYDGTAVNLQKTNVIHLTRELAEEVFLAADCTR